LSVPSPQVPLSFPSQADKRAHHNALERKRRDHIKDSFHSLRDSVPSLQGEK
ncbi:Protein max, partial [Mesitornis unicolor]